MNAVQWEHFCFSVLQICTLKELYCYTAAASFRPKNIKGMESFVVAPTVVIFHLSFSYFLSDVVSFNLG